MARRYGRVILAAAIGLLLCLGIPALAEALNGLKPGGTPLGLAMAAQGAPLLLIFAALALGPRHRSRVPAAQEDRPS